MRMLSSKIQPTLEIACVSLAFEPACQLKQAGTRQLPASDIRNAAISSLLRTSRMSPASTGWFQVFPSIAGNRASSVNRSATASTSAAHQQDLDDTVDRE